MKGSLVRDRWMSTPSRRIVGSSGRSGFLAPHKPTISPRNCILSPGEFASYLEVSSSWEEDDEEYTAGSDDDDDISYSDGLPSDLDQSEDESPLGDDVFSFEGDEADHEPEPVPADVPFWFGHEDQEHVEQVMSRYQGELVRSEELQRSHRPFVASVARTAWQPSLRESSGAQLFQTFDEVQVCNNQRVRANRPQPALRTHFLLTTWDSDGVPISFFHPPPATVSSLRGQTEGAERVYLYRQPEWFERHPKGRLDPDSPPRDFCYSSSSMYHTVGYVHLPSHDSPYYDSLRDRLARREDISYFQNRHNSSLFHNMLQFSPP